MKVSVVIPAYNEEQAVGSVIAELRDVLRRHRIEAEIIVVDDGSTDQGLRPPPPQGRAC